MFFYVWKRVRHRIISVVVICFVVYSVNYLLQAHWAHREEYSVPEYDRVFITEETDRETLFLQTGLGEQAVEKLISEEQFELALKLQNAVFEPRDTDCVSLLG